MRVAVIGCGSAGRRHIGNLLELGCEVACYDVALEARERVRRDFPPVVFGLLTECDAWVIATPHDQHLDWASAAVAQKRPLFVEKPLGALDQIEDWRRLIQESAGLTTQVGYQCRFHAVARQIKDTIREPHHVSVTTLCDWWSDKYGPLPLEASHELDLALWWGLDVSEPRPHMHTVWPLNFSTANGSVHVAAGEYYRRWHIEDNHWTVEFDWRSSEALGDEMYRLELQHFLECVREGKPTDVPLSDGLRVLEVVQQFEQLTKVAA